jgi:hypothetical protein
MMSSECVPDPTPEQAISQPNLLVSARFSDAKNILLFYLDGGPWKNYSD